MKDHEIMVLHDLIKDYRDCAEKARDEARKADARADAYLEAASGLGIVIDHLIQKGGEGGEKDNGCGKNV